MAIRERYQYVVDLITDNASRSVGSFGSALDTAETKTGRFQSTLGRAGTFLKENIAAAAATAGSALVTFGIQSVKAFQETALAAGKFSDATGLAVEDASRWIEVAGDVGVSTETVSGLFVRLNKAVGDNAPVVKELGIEQQKLADGTTDVNATMVEAIRRLNEIKDPTERATAAQALFGRGYKEAAEIIFTSADGLVDKLGEVSDAKVIDEEELAKARDFRATLDNLKDSLEDITLVVGEQLVPILGDLGDGLTDIKDTVDDIPGLPQALEATARSSSSGIKALGDALTFVTGQSDNASDSADAFVTAQDAVADAVADAQAAAEEAAPAYAEIDDRAEGVATALDNAASAAEREEAQARRNIETTKRLTDEYNDQKDSIDDLIGRKAALIGGDIAVRQAQRDARTAADELNTALEDQSLTLEDLAPIIDDATEANLNAAQAAADRRADELEANGTLVDSKTRNQLLKEELQRLADQTNGPLRAAIQGYIDDLNRIPTSVNTNITQNGTTDIRYGRQGFDAGTPLGGNKDTGVIVSAQSFGTSTGKQLPPINITVNAGIGTDGRQVGRQIVEALEAFFRSGGQLPPTMAQRLGG